MHIWSDSLKATRLSSGGLNKFGICDICFTVISVTLILFVCYFCYQSLGSSLGLPSPSSKLDLVFVSPFYSLSENAAICCSFVMVRNRLHKRVRGLKLSPVM